MSKTAIAEQSWTRLRSSLARKNKPSWPEPELSIGTWYRKMGMSDCWEAKGPARNQYGPLSEDIKSILDERIECLNEGEPVSKTVTFSPYMTGWKRTSAKPTIIFCCERPLPRRRAKDLIKNSGILNKYPGWILGDCSFPPEFDEPLTRLAFGDPGTQVSTLNGAAIPRTVLYRPSERAYGIEIFIQDNGNQSGTRRATVGGIIRSQGRYYGLTVAHAFSEAEASRKLTHKVEFEFDLDSSNEEDWSDDEIIADVTSRGSQSPASRSPKTASSIISRFSEADLTETSFNKPSAPGIPAPLPTQADDVSIYSECGAESKQTVDGSLVVFGDLSISAEKSGLASLDWALILIRETETQSFKDLNKNGPGPRFLRPDRAVERLPRKTAVIAITASGDILHGSLSGTPSYIHVPQTKNFQEVWTVNLEGKLRNGDCGTWVMNEQAGTIYGHIISGTVGSGVTYIVPACHIFNDIGLYLPNFEIYVGADLSILSKSCLNSNFIRVELLKESQAELVRLEQERSDRNDEWSRMIEALKSTFPDLSEVKRKLKQDKVELQNRKLELHQQPSGQLKRSTPRINSSEGTKMSRRALWGSWRGEATEKIAPLPSLDPPETGNRPTPKESLPTGRETFSPSREADQYFGKLILGDTALQLRGKPYGRNIEHGREFVLEDINGAQIIHRIKFANGRKRCCPYASSSSKTNGGVCFLEDPPDQHTVMYGAKSLPQWTPIYKFPKLSYRKFFQGLVRDQELVDEFSCERIRSRRGSEASHVLLQIWRSTSVDSLSVSYYANGRAPLNMEEFPIIEFGRFRRLFGPYVELCLNNLISVSGLDEPSRPSKIRRDSNIQQPDQTRLNLERREFLKQMRYLEFTFSSEDEAQRFMSQFNSLEDDNSKVEPLVADLAPDWTSGLDWRHSQISAESSAMKQNFSSAMESIPPIDQSPSPRSFFSAPQDLSPMIRGLPIEHQSSSPTSQDLLESGLTSLTDALDRTLVYDTDDAFWNEIGS